MPRSMSRGRSNSRSPSRSRSISPRRSLSPAPRRRSRSRSYYSRSRSRSRTPPLRSTKIVVEKLTKNVNENHLRELFEVFGEIEDMDLPMNRQYGTNRGTAYILYCNEADADQAISHMHESQLDGAVITVSVVIPRRKFSPSPPVARRGPGYGARGGRDMRGAPPPRGPPAREYRDREGDSYRPRSLSRSRSPRRHRSRSRSYSRSRSPPRRGRRDNAKRNGRSKRDRSYDSYDSRSRSRSRSPAKEEIL